MLDKEAELIVDSEEVEIEELQEFQEQFAKVYGNSLIEALMSAEDKAKKNNVAIFVDYDNVYWTLMNNYLHDPDHEDPEKNLFIQLWKRYGRDHVRTFRVYADFEKIKTQLTSLQKKRVQIRHVYSNGKSGDKRKNSSDIELCIDAIESTYRDNKISCYVFVTADSDMIPIMSRMMYKGKKVELFYLKDAAPKHVDITSYAHYSQDLMEFLHIERKDYDIEELVIPALRIIADWYEAYESNREKFLGQGWLVNKLVKDLKITQPTSSTLIEKLLVEGLIYEGTKEHVDGQKKTIRLTEKGTGLLEMEKEMASS